MRSFVSYTSHRSWAAANGSKPFIQKKPNPFFTSERASSPFIQPAVKPAEVSSKKVNPSSVSRKGDVSALPSGDNRIQASSDFGTYAVESGDTFASIAKTLSISVQKLVALNPKYTYDSGSKKVKDKSGSVATLKEGTLLKVPNTASLKVGKGDTGKLNLNILQFTLSLIHI